MRGGHFVACAVVSLALPCTSGAATASAVPVITTIAGGVGGPGIAVGVALGPCGVSARGGSVYTTNGVVVWRLDAATDELAPVAGVGRRPDGSGIQGNNGNGAAALTAQLKSVCGTAGDASGNLLLADAGVNRVKVLAGSTGSYYGQSMTAGGLYTVAGGGIQGLGDGGSALKAELSTPRAVAVDHAGNLVITDTGDGRIRVVAVTTGTFYGQSMTAGDIYTVFAHTGALDQAAVDMWGNLVVADPASGTVYVVAETSGTFYGQPMTAGSNYPVAPLAQASPGSVAVDGTGNIVLLNPGLVQVVAATSGSFYGQNMTAGQVYTVAGGGSSAANGIPALQAALVPDGVAVDGSGNLVIAEGSPDDLLRVVAVTTGTFFGQPMTAGNVYTVAGNGSTIFSGDGGPATSAELASPRGAGVDAAGNLLIADTYNHAIRVLAKATGMFYGQQMTEGSIYAIAGTGNQAPDGVPALQAGLANPQSVAVDSFGNVLIADYTGHGTILIIAEHTGTFYGKPMIAGDIYPLTYGAAVRLDRFGNLLLTDAAVSVFAATTGVFYGQNMTAGQVYRVAGGGTSALNGIPALQASLQAADTIIDAAGNLVIADAGNNMIRVVAYNPGTYYGQVMKAGYIYTVAGTGQHGTITNGIPALNAELYGPLGVAVDAAGNLVIADSRDNQVRVVAAKTGTYYGQQMTAGDIYLLAGTGRYAFGGDGGPASQAWMALPRGVRIIPGGGILIFDDNRTRLITG